MFTIDLTGKTAIVTGSSQGLGLATAKCLHAAGANVVINYFPDSAGKHARQAAEAVAALGERAVAAPADVRSADDTAALVAVAVRTFGSLEILVNNAGIIRDVTVKKMSADDWQDVIDTNLSGVFRMCKSAAVEMSDGGRIVNLSSISALIGFFGQANYSASKAGVIALTKVLSRELAKRQITVNAIAPGVVLTEMGRSIPASSREQMLTQIPLGRFGEADDIAHAILFLCSPLASYITGQTLHVNGGWVG
ncbi:MAG: 3-oxoacyl-ACP reductase FabG [Pirellulaceae bacterium]|nr:3-oxoacyl-ACP reductase FabG [Pirellulaceae bacterium]